MSTSNGAKSPTNDKDEVEDDPGLIQYLKPDTQQAKLLPKQNFSDAAVTIESVDQNHKEREGDGNLAHKWNSHFMAGHNELMKSFIAGHDKRMQMFHSVFEQVGGHKPNDHSNKDPQFLKADIMCLVWKRRDGLAKLSNSWERRLIALVVSSIHVYLFARSNTQHMAIFLATSEKYIHSNIIYLYRVMIFYIIMLMMTLSLIVRSVPQLMLSEESSIWQKHIFRFTLHRTK